jgi:hypothetical protein
LYTPRLLPKGFFFFFNELDSIAQDYPKPSGNDNKDQGLSIGGGRFVPSKRVLELRNRLIKFMEDRIYPMENEFYKLAQSTSRWTVHQEEEKLKELATKEGLWNLWIPVCILIFLSIYTFYVYFFFLEA